MTATLTRPLPLEEEETTLEAASLKTIEEVEEHIDHLQEIAETQGADVVRTALDIGMALRRGREIFKAEKKKGFREWASDRWSYKHSYVQRLMDLADPLATHRVEQLIQDDPDLTVRRLMGIVAEEIRDKARPGPRELNLAEASTPDDVLLRVLDARKSLRSPEGFDEFIGGGVNLVVTSWPYCLGQDDKNYADFVDYDDWRDAATKWAEQLYAILGPKGRAAVNLPIDIRKGQTLPRPIGADGLDILRRAGLTYQGSIVWSKAAHAGGQKSNSVARGSVCSPNAPAIATGQELVWILSRGGEWNLGRQRDKHDLDDEALLWTNGEWQIPGETDRQYPHVMARPLAERLIRLLSYPGDLVADFHCGRGTTAVAAATNGRRFVGGDINPYAVALASRNVAAALESKGDAQ